MWRKRLSSALDLVEYEQDWGICNADPTRVSEFIRFYQENSVEHPWEPEVLAELIFQSLNEALQNSPVDDSVLDGFRTFLRSHLAEFPQTLRYWKSLEENEEFPVAKMIVKQTA